MPAPRECPECGRLWTECPDRCTDDVPPPATVSAEPVSLAAHIEWLTARIRDAETARAGHDAERPSRGDLDAWLDRDEELHAVVSRLYAARAFVRAHLAEVAS